jgi:two-component system phosphate regulon response regulator PhoB
MTEKLPPKILVVETDEVQRSMLCNTIERYWFSVLRAKDADAATKMMTLDKPHVVVISSRIQDTNATELAQKLRTAHGCSEMPIIFILNEDESEDGYTKIDNTFLEFVRRPFTPNEVMTAIKNLIRKAKPVFQDKIITYQDLSMDLATFRVYRKDKRIHLGPTEFKILQLLVQAPKTIFSRQEIIDYVWGLGKDIEPRTVDVHVNRLRSLIKLDRLEIPFIKTIRNSGYCLNLPGEIC